MRKIILMCAQGMSTSVMVKRIREAAKSEGYECTVNAYAVAQAKTVGADADIIILGPQIRFDKEQVISECPDIPVEIIDMAAYGRMDGKKVLEQVKKSLGD